MKRPKHAPDQPTWMAPSPPLCGKVTIGHVTDSVIFFTKITERYMTLHHIDI